MEHSNIYQTLLDEVRSAYLGHPDTLDFAPFPDDVRPQDMTPFHARCGDAFREEMGLSSDRYPDLQNAIKAAGPHALWRETYKGTDIGDDFMRKFGCFSIIGKGGPFTSDKLWAFMVYMPSGLYYPWHQHPAEEMYFVVSGSGVFKREGCQDEILTAGQTVFNSSNQPHAMETRDEPVLCLVFWRDRFETAPVLSPDE
ncbi:UNVERIFIED_CONTAM: hypothetical protein GTU68_014101 [Idotea baltica]|nr:hypothetical protein [Idotea baltica]